MLKRIKKAPEVFLNKDDIKFIVFLWILIVVIVSFIKRNSPKDITK